MGVVLWSYPLTDESRNGAEESFRLALFRQGSQTRFSTGETELPVSCDDIKDGC